MSCNKKTVQRVNESANSLGEKYVIPKENFTREREKIFAIRLKNTK